MIAGKQCFISMLLAWFVIANQALAFEVKLSQVEIRSIEDQSISLLIYNPRDTPLALETQVFYRTLDTDGKETLEKEFEDIMAVPAQVVVTPKGKTVVNLHWMNPKMPKKEIPLRVSVAEVAVNWEDAQKGDGAAFGFTYQLVKSLYIRPKSTYANLKWLKWVDNQDNSLSLFFENIGDSRGTVRNLRLRINDQEQMFYLHQLVLAGHKATYQLELPEQFKGKKITTVELIALNE